MVDRIKVKDLAQAMGKTIPEIIFILNSLGIQKSSEDDELTQEEAKMLISGQVPTVQKPIIIREDSDKKEIKKAIESLFETKIVSVQTMFDQKNRKKAIVKFKTPGIAGEIAVRLGII